MSIIERSNPLNLSYQICIVSGASSELGTIICKTLLKANAFVFGVDTSPKHDSLNAGSAMHFSFEECDLADAGSAEKVIESVRVKHKTDRIDLLVNVVEDGAESRWRGISNLSESVAHVMSSEGKGRVVNVIGNDNVATDEAIKLSKKIGEEHKNVDCSVLVPSKGSDGREGAQKYKGADQYMSDIKNVRDGDPKHSTERSKFYEIANLALYLAGNMSDVSQSIVYMDGSHQPL